MQKNTTTRKQRPTTYRELIKSLRPGPPRDKNIATHLSAAINFLEEVHETKPTFISRAVENAIIEQFKSHNETPIRYAEMDYGFGDKLQALLMLEAQA